MVAIEKEKQKRHNFYIRMIVIDFAKRGMIISDVEAEKIWKDWIKPKCYL